MKDIEKYWKLFLVENPQYKNAEYSVWHFCDNREDADELAELVRKGTKRGTASLEKSYLIESEALPAIGEISIITNWRNEAQCIIETIKIHKYKFRDVPEDFAKIEGEGDKSIGYWKKVHKEAFTREAALYKYDFNEELNVICEEFRVLFIS